MANIQQNIEINKKIGTALQECNCTRPGDVSTQSGKNGGALRSSAISFLTLAEIRSSGREKLAHEVSSPLDTLAQVAPNSINSLKKRAKAKYITNGIIFPLIDLDSDLKTSYWRTYRCAETLEQKGNKIIGKYCNNRWCIVCNRIRTAKLIDGYLPVIKKEIPDPYFITLTIPNVSARELKPAINKMIKEIVRINKSFRKYKDFRLKGIRKLECTFNSELRNFHPHFHFLVDTEIAGRELINSWLKSYPSAERAAQDIRPADQKSLIEIFKYTTKIFTKKDITLEGDILKMKMNPWALDVIFKALYNKRVFQSMGINKIAVSEDIDEIQAQEIETFKLVMWEWENEISDWIDKLTGEQLTGCEAYKRYKIQRE